MKTVGIRVFADPTTVYIAEQGSDDTNNELRAEGNCKPAHPFMDIEDYKGIYRDRLKSYVFDTMKWLQEELCRSHTEIHG